MIENLFLYRIRSLQVHFLVLEVFRWFNKSKSILETIKLIQLSHKFRPFTPLKPQHNHFISNFKRRIETSTFSQWIMPRRLIHILATIFDVIWTDRSLIKICILYPFRNIGEASHFFLAKCLWWAKKKFQIQCFPGDLRWINIPFLMCSYTQLLSSILVYTAVWEIKAA